MYHTDINFLVSSKNIFTVIFLYLFFCSACANSATPEEISRLKAKANMAEHQLRIAVDTQKDVSKIVPKMKHVKVLADDGNIKRADALLDEILLDFKQLNAPSSGTGNLFVNPRRVNIVGNPYNAMEPFISRDGDYLFFNSNKTDIPKTEKNIYYSVRIDDTNFQFMGEVKGINSDSVDGVPTMDIHGNFYYVSAVHYSKKNGFTTVYKGKFLNGEVVNITPIEELSLRKPYWLNMDIEISADGNTIYSTQTYFPGFKPIPKKSYFFQAHLINGKFIVDENSESIFKNINTGDPEYAASISTDELEIYFTRLKHGDKPQLTSYYAIRADKSSPFDKPVKIEAIKGFSEAPAITNDGKLLYYHKKDGDRFYIYVLERAY